MHRTLACAMALACLLSGPVRAQITMDQDGRYRPAIQAVRHAVRTHYSAHRRVRHRAYVRHGSERTNARRVAAAAVDGAKRGSLAGAYASTQVVSHPAGCPRTEFCGCGVARHIFGRIDGAMRALWLAANWFRFPRAEPAPGMVAVRRHHVFAIERVIDRGHVLAWDPNSGGHLTRLHVRSLAGYRVVNPKG